MLVDSLWTRATFFTLTQLDLVLDAWTQAATFEQARKAEPHNIGVETAYACCARGFITFSVLCWSVDIVLKFHALCFVAFVFTACCARLAERVTKFLCAIPSEDFLSFCSDRANSFCCLLYTSPSPRDKRQSRMPSSA